MEERKGVDIVIDKLTNSIENTFTGDKIQTEVSLLSSSEIKKITKKSGWLFNWKLEIKYPERDVYKLTIVNNQDVIQGLICLEVKADHVFLHLIESAPLNKGKSKIYSGVPGNLVAFACKLSFQKGYDGCVSFVSKSQLINHYQETLGAIHFGGRLMIIETPAALRLINRYFKQ